FFGGFRTEGVSRLEWIAEQYPGDAAAPKLLANHFLEAGDAAAARRHGEKALAAAPYDLAIRADLARALLLAGEPERARAHARIIDRADPNEKQRALAGSEDENSLATLHLELGDLAEAERDARRLLLGSPTEKVQGQLALGTLDLLRGAFPSGVDQLGAAADLAASSGVATVATSLRWRAIWAAYHSGELERARAQIGKLPADSWKAARAVVLALLDHKTAPPAERAHHLAHARATADSLQGLLRLQLLALVAHERRDWDAVLSLQEQIAAATRSRSLTALYLIGDAQAGRSRLDEAAATFERLVRDPQAWREPVLSGRAWRRLGEVRAARGDRAGAAEAYRTLLARWTLAPATDPDLTAAQAGLADLNGPANGPSTVP
ncbi:MAG TPA: tetratricopeptide repeat protein, partial [Kofleriaceae bacterium]|nr:tetratricopeptide repeat protein [Kofleriaceae bacterium]